MSPRRSVRRLGARSPQRSGTVLVAAMALLALSSALLIGTFASARALTQATRSTSAVARVEGAGRRTLAEMVVGWSATLDSLPIGDIVARETAELVADAGPPLTADAHVLRLSDRLFVVVVDVRAGEGAALLAHRRYRMLLERPARVDSSSSYAAPVIIARWSLAEIH